VSTEHFRFGASGLLNNLLATINEEATSDETNDY